MEFTGSGADSSSRNPAALSRSFLSIDLNQIPSPAAESLPSPSLSVSPISLVRSFHDNPAPPEGPPAEIPGDGKVASCGACGLLEIRGQVVVCDGCERGFHFVCAGMTAAQAAAVEEWVCGECRTGGVGSRRWPLGKKLGCGGGIRLLDINASPPSDVDGAGNGEDEADAFGVRDSRYEASRLCCVSSAAPLTGGSFSDGLPIQYEDFFLLSVGDVDARPSYHDASHIWPVGYRSCWHDKITGSLFLCYVVDGGDTGPLFKIRRFSCSSLPIPYGSTILCRKSFDTEDSEEVDRLTYPIPVYEEDCSVDTMLCDPSLPVDDEVLSWLGSSSYEAYDAHEQTSSREKGNPSKGSHKTLGTNLFVGDKIDEFSIDGRSPSAVWGILSQKLIDACRLIYKRTGSLRFFCKHAEDGASSLCYNIEAKKNKGLFSCLDKFCSLLGTISIPGIVRNDQEFELASDILKNWMNLDRYGLDVDFVQEVIEQLPSVRYCSQYKSLKSRNGYSVAPLVGNGLLLINAKGKSCEQGSTPDNSERAWERTKTGMVADPILANRSLPSGKILGAKLPPQLVGDILQAWELLLRFHELLGLEGALLFDDLEAELISPWSDNLCPSEKSGRGFEDDQNTTCNASREMTGQTSSSSSEIDTSKNNPHIFIGIEMEAGKQEADACAASSSFSRCTGIILRKVHISLLNVLLSELHLKVATVLDPTLDGGELKPRRGRKRDVDNTNLTKKSKLSILPINALTWPDLARRYLLSVLCMDGNSDSAETTVRESSKVFRCLQGDGGVLCGSLVGIAGIEADALLLAEARKRIYGSLNTTDHLLSIEDAEGEATISAAANEEPIDINIPEWANDLEPVRRLPTNVGTRIRKCIYAALEKDPPEWAKKILEHSISKAVYKGNASGPTKKAVLSVLATISGGVVPPKPTKEKKKKRVISVPDIIMRQCRIVLRRTASEDDEKVFCNLLGRNLMNSSDNDDEGLIGCPGTVSRPLDFRTIDLRLALGSYGGSHEAFVEDVCELWSNLRTVYADQSDVVKLVEKLSQKFESLYEEEVIPLLEKLIKFAELERIDPEAKKELADIVKSTSEIPKAPWDEGICKVCGIDKDDDSVLLCDKCDAEYHTYCLNPPLARIPEGNWYCPSCASGGKIASKGAPLLIQRGRKRYRSDIIQRYLEELTSLAAMMEETEYWDFNVHERTLLLKFLCDELLSSSLIHQHLEQCADTSGDLQQKLRSLYSEIKLFKVREDLLLSRAAKVSQNLVNVAVDQQKLLHVGPSSDDKKTADSEAKQSTDSQSHLAKPIEGQNQPEEIDLVIDDDSELNGNHIDRPKKRQKPREDSMSKSRSQEANGIINEASHQSVRVLEGTRSDSTIISDALPVVSVSSSGSGQVAEFVSPLTLNDAQALNIELNSIRKDISATQQSIADAETHLLKLSIRMEFLGNDHAGRLYWLSAKTGEYPSVIVDGTMALQRGKQRVDGKARAATGSIFKDLTLSGSGNLLTLEGSNASCPFLYEAGSSVACSQWTSYQSESEVKSLLEWFRKDDPKEKELKDSVLHWQKLRIFVALQAGKPKQTESMALLRSNGKTDDSNSIVAKASTVLEKIYGPCFEVKMDDTFKKQLKKARLTGDGKMYRCKCLEPIWGSRHHCLHCHKTFLIAVEFDKHSIAHCSSDAAALEKKETNGPPVSHAKSESQIVGASKSPGLELSSDLIKFQNEGLTCPHRFEEISSKFVTNDSIKELVRDIGLLGSDGRPAFIQLISPHLTDPKLVFAPTHGSTRSNQDLSSGKEVYAQGIDNRGGVQPRNSHGISQTDKYSANMKTDRSLPGSQVVRERKIFSGRRGLSSEVSHCVVVRESSLRPLVGRAAQILKHLKISLLDVEAALPEEALRLSRVHVEKRLAWRAFVKGAETIFELVQATIVLEDMIKAEYLRNEWYYWSSLSAAARISTLSALAFRIYSLDNAIIYEKAASVPNPPKNVKPSSEVEQPLVPNSDSSEKPRSGRRNSRKRKETDG